jgi:hypothetical protein
MVNAFIHEFGPVLGDRNQKGSISATLRTAQASGFESDINLLICLVRAYVVERDTREVRPTHRHPDGDNRMPIYFAMFRTFAEAWAADNFHYTEEDLIADLALPIMALPQKGRKTYNGLHIPRCSSRCAVRSTKVEILAILTCGGFL